MRISDWSSDWCSSDFPKIFMGYSDITAFHQAIYTQTGLVTFHGAVANSRWTPMVFNQFKQLFFDGKSPVYSANQRAVRTLTSGTAEGKLLGGNLTVDRKSTRLNSSH